jgi:hypothetical protein
MAVVNRLRDAAAAVRCSHGVVALMLVVASCGGTCGSQSATQPIEGYWSWEGDGVQQITAGSTGFEGTIVKASSIGRCAAPIGRVVLRLTGSGNHFTGQDEWFRDSDCARRFSNDAVVDLINGNKTAHLCSSGPFTDVAPVSNCVDLSRILDFKPT